MIGQVLLIPIERFGRRFRYDISYLRYLVRADPNGALKFALATRLGFHRRVVPLAAWHAAKITTARGEDCGPCTQLVVDMALKEGVPADIVAAVLAGQESAMGTDAVIGWRLARGVVEHRADLLDEAIAEATARWGERGHACLALVIAGSRLYPTLKAGLGYAKSCQRISVAGRDVTGMQRDTI